MKRLKNDLWLPNQVKEEFDKHRKSKLHAPLDLYKNLITTTKVDSSGYLPKIQDGIKKIENLVNKTKDETNKNDKHPFLDQEVIDSFVLDIKVFSDRFEGFKSAFEKLIHEKVENLKSKNTIENDAVYMMVNNLFQKNIPYTFSELLSIYQEGKIRYEYDIPPGFMDAKGKNKKDGTAIFGDLVIWKEILDIGKKTGKSILLISNDTKEDWCVDKKNPRIELIKEYKDFVGKDFWMCTLSHFIFDLNDKFNSVMNEETLDEVVRNNIFNIDDLKNSVSDWILEEFNELGQVIYEYPLSSSNYGTLDIYVEVNHKKVGFEIRGMKISTDYLRKRCNKIENMLINSNLIECFYFIITYDLSKEEAHKLLDLQNNCKSIYFLIYDLGSSNLEKI